MIAALLIAACLVAAGLLIDPAPKTSRHDPTSIVRFQLLGRGDPPLASEVWADIGLPANSVEPVGGDGFQWLALSRRDLSGLAGTDWSDYRNAKDLVKVVIQLRRADVSAVEMDRRTFERQHRPFPAAGVPYDPTTRGHFNSYWFAADDGEQVAMDKISNMALDRRIGPHVFAVSIFEPLPPSAVRSLDLRLTGWLRQHLLCVQVRRAPGAQVQVLFDGAAHGNAGCAGARAVSK